MSNKPINLRYSLITAFLQGEKRHPIDYIKDEGMVYKTAEAYSIGDCCIFFDCSNIPDPLPKFLEKVEFDK